MIRQDFTIQCC